MTTYQLTSDDMNALAEAEEWLTTGASAWESSEVRVTYVYGEKQVSAVFDVAAGEVRFEVTYS